MKKQLWMTLGPVFIAFVIFTFILFGPKWLFGKVSKESVANSASSMNADVLQGMILQRKALEEGRYVPFYGSSELARIDAFHPNVLTEKYKLGYTPFLIGRPGTQSLSHYLDIVSLGDSLKGKKVVYILSPQWFKSYGVNDGHFNANFSPLQAYTFALSERKQTPERMFAAKRLLSYKIVQNDDTLKKLLTYVAQPKGKELDVETKLKGALQLRILQRKDVMDSKYILGTKQGHINKQMHKLPRQFDMKKIDQLAEVTGKAQAHNNPYYIKDSYYNRKIKSIEPKLKNSRVDGDYVNSPEYGDLQLVMDAFKSAGADVLFINPPVNGAWYKYIGFPDDALRAYYKKSGDLIRSQGFSYYDMSIYNDTPYYLQDSIHLGWRGWVAITHQVNEFVKQPMTKYSPISEEYYEKQLKDRN
ncbi:D-alanyl-lipoteichoic acid biosynthesis protein DltD [Bacillus massiliigorillae]|uniref:D-alanyl-lipoteichoic acid biosynthesis protein DltD n=1 Tax=Bacillus massiliigorillae TaxID=1243664 RepID=UPI0003A59879|nr:D-alanyl-lipoteichoic acid biosynthesis protein DltD [Bacillus massiliigorillae]